MSILLISLYSPTHGKDDEFLECIDFLSEFLLINLSENEEIVIGADTNCSSKSTTKRKQAWKIFCDSFSLENKSGPEETFHHHNGSSNSWIDMFVASKSLDLSLLHQLCTLNNPRNLSSHDALISSTSISAKKVNETSHEKTYSKFVREKVIWNQEKIPDYELLAAKALTEAGDYWSTPCSAHCTQTSL